MSVFKCKMCGGNLGPEDGSGIAVCEYCGTQQTLSKSEDEIVKNFYNRANSLRLQCEFDRAEEIYEKILEIDQTEAEAHWGLVLCAYGIEYVEEPGTLKRIPTCHRTSYEAVTASADYLAAIEYGDAVQRELYKKEAEAIDKIQRSILDIVKKEEPFDVFICYKETGNDGNRTEDSVIAGAIYDQLTKEGFKVFFAAVTLENRLGEEYEPYIFAALHSARVMLAIGTKPEHLQAVWVKNEWSRYLKLLKTDPGRLLIPCYRGMDAYELPEELSHLQAQDLSKIGAVQDLIRGIRKIVRADDARTGAGETGRKETVVIQESGGTVQSLLKRVFLFLEDKDWGSADRYCEKVLDQDPENAMAYVGKLMAELHVPRQEELVEVEIPFDDHNNYRKAMRFADDELRNTLENYITQIRERNETERKTLLYEEACTKMNAASTDDEYIAVGNVFQGLGNFEGAEMLMQECWRMVEKIRSAKYDDAVTVMQKADTENSYRRAAQLFEALPDFRDSDQLRETCLEHAEIAHKDELYESAVQEMQTAKEEYDFRRAADILKQIPGWRDADEQILICGRLEKKAQVKEKRKKWIKILLAFVAALIVAGVCVYVEKIAPERKYKEAIFLLEDREYEAAYDSLKELANEYDYKDSEEKWKDIGLILQENKLKNASVGDLVEFGYYDQDNDITTGDEIEWVVLEKRDQAVLLLSSVCLANRQYAYYRYFDRSWKNTEIREWLNQDFLESAFDKKYKDLLIPHTVYENSWELSEEGVKNKEMDLVSLLPDTMVWKYAADTPLVKKTQWSDAATPKGRRSDIFWWCRQMNETEKSPQVMNRDGILEKKEEYAYCGVRPVIWVSLKFGM